MIIGNICHVFLLKFLDFFSKFDLPVATQVAQKAELQHHHCRKSAFTPVFSNLLLI